MFIHAVLGKCYSLAAININMHKCISPSELLAIALITFVGVVTNNEKYFTFNFMGPLLFCPKLPQKQSQKA